MTPKDQNILKTAGLLMLLFQTKKPFTVEDSEERYTLHVKKEHTFDTQLTIPDFIYSCKILEEEGYLFCAPFIDSNHRNVLGQVIVDPTQFPEIELAKNEMNEPERLALLHENVINAIKNVLPKNYATNFQENEVPDFTIDDLSNEGMKGIGTDILDLVAVIILMPFRDIERVYTKMQGGLSFDEVKDPGLWYEADKYTLHFEENEIVLAHQNKPNKSHYVLLWLFSNKEHHVDYVDIPEFDHNKEIYKEKRTFKDSLLGLLKHNPELEKVFIVGTHAISIADDYIEHTH